MFVVMFVSLGHFVVVFCCWLSRLIFLFEFFFGVSVIVAVTVFLFWWHQNSGPLATKFAFATAYRVASEYYHIVNPHVHHRPLTKTLCSLFPYVFFQWNAFKKPIGKLGHFLLIITLRLFFFNFLLFILICLSTV